MRLICVGSPALGLHYHIDPDILDTLNIPEREPICLYAETRIISGMCKANPRSGTRATETLD